jgi:hypothetical protein
MSRRRNDRPEERVYKSLWHLFIAGVGVYEFRHHKTTLSKVLATGLIAFHIDGAIADIMDTKPASQRVLDYVLGEPSEPKKTTCDRANNRRLKVRSIKLR